MKNIYTFVSYLLFRFFIQKTICLELNIGKITDYSSGSSQVTVKKTTELQNLYTHKFSNPVLLKDIYNGKERLYFDQLLVSDQLLLSASVVWSFETPSIIQLNLEQSSVLLINEKESLDVQAIFSKKLVTNIKPRIHSDIDAIVDINLSNIADYDSNNSKVYVTNLKFSEDRFKRYTLRNYNLESTRLGKILYNNTELTTKFENDVKRSTESNLDIPYKNNVYSIQVYAYNNFPLLIEFLYTFDKRQFYGYTPEEKWHHVYFPAFHDPSFLDFLYDKLNYYACKNGFKYTIDINQKTDTSDRSYQIDNYCIGSEGVETVVNNLKLASYINEINIERVHRCFEHTPSNDNKFFIDHLMYNSTVIQLKDTPKVTKSVRVYQHLNHEPYLIVFVDDLDKLYHYKFQNGKWKNDDNIILLLDKTSLYEKSLVTSVLASATPSTLSESNYEHQPNEVNVLLENSTPLQSSGFKCYSHSIQPNGSSESLQLRVLVPTSAEAGKYTEISFYNDDKTKRDFIYYLKASGNDNNNKLYTYYSAPENHADARPMLLCYGGKAYRPHSLDKYFEEWVRVSSISHCETPDSGSEANKLLETLVQVSELLNPVNIKLSGQTAYTVHTFNGTPVQNVVSKTAGTSVTGCKFCYDKYVHTAKQGYRLGNVSYDASCIKFGTNERDAKCISATTAVNPYTTAEEVVIYYFKDDAEFSVPLLVAIKNGNSYRPYYTLKSNTSPYKLYQKVDEQIDLANFEALGEKLNQIRHDFAKTLQVIIGNRQGDGGSKTYRGKIYEVSGRQVQTGPTLPISLSDAVELPNEGEFKWFKYYEHRFKGETGINAIGGLRLFLRDLGPNNVMEIKLHSDANGLTPINKLSYNSCKGNVHVYFSEDTDERPLLVCYGGKAYRPLNKESYTTKWVPVDTITKCPCETGQNSTLLAELRKTLLMLNVIETYIIQKATTEHSTCKLFKFYRNQLMYDKVGDIQVCKDAQCSNKVILREGDYKNHTVLFEELYYNRYDWHFTHPIMLVLHYQGQDKQEHKKYYRFSEFESDKTNTSAKTTFGLPAYPSEKEFLLKMIADNDAVLGSITYQIDHKDNTYNSSKVNVDNTTNNSNNIKNGRFIRYKHTPKNGIKKSFILHKLNILTQWNATDKRAVSIDDVQELMIKQIDVYFSPESDEVLLVGFFHNNKVDYFYQKLYEKNAIHWEPLNENATNEFLKRRINKANIHDELIKNDNEVMVQLLNKLKETAEQTYYKFGLASSPNAINTYQKPTSGEEYPPCKLMLKYEFTPTNQQIGKNLTVFKSDDEKLTLKPDGEYANMVYSRSEVYYNKYDETNTPLLIVLHFTGGTKYYKMSNFTTDKAQGKNISSMGDYTDDKTVLTPLLEENDGLGSLITYRIDQKIDSTAQNNYNGGKISLAEESVQELKQKGFSKYTHRPTANNNSKKACVIYNGDVLLSQDESGAMVVITGLQNIVYTSVTVYYSINLDMPLLISFLKQDSKIDYYYINKQGALTFWNHLDKHNYQNLLSEKIENENIIHSKLTESNSDKLIKLLKKIEASLINAVIVLLSKQTTYNKEEMERRLKSAVRKPKNVQELSESQPDSIVVKRQDNSKLKSLNFECFIQTIIPKGPFKSDLRIMVPSYDEFTNIEFQKTEPDVDYRSKIIFDLDQRGHRTYYDAEKYYMFVQKKEFTNLSYLRYAHTCSSCGNWSNANFAIRFDGITVNFLNNLPETIHKRIDVYFHKSYPEKFSTVVFHQPKGYNPRYFGYSDFFKYYKNNKVVELSSLAEFNHKYEDNINAEFKKVLDVEYPNLQKIYRLNTEIILYEKAQTDLYVYFEASYVGPMMFCYHNKAYIPRSRDNYYGEWVQVKSIKSCQCQGENEQKILNTIAHVYMSLNTDDKKIIRDRWDYNANDDAIKTLPDNLSILTITNAQVTISTIHNDKIKKHNIIQKLELDFYYFNSYSTYVQYSGDLTNNLTITAKSNYGIDIIKFYYINIMTLPEGSYVHRIEYIRDTPTDEVTIHLHTNTLFVYSYVRKYDDWYKPFHFIGITRIKPFNHSNEVDKYFEKIRALNRKNFFITRIFKLS